MVCEVVINEHSRAEMYDRQGKLHGLVSYRHTYTYI